MVLAWSGTGVWALVGGSATTGLVQCSLLFALSGWRPGRLVGSRRLGPFQLRYSGAPCWVAGSCGRYYPRAIARVLGRLADDASLGFYAMMARQTRAAAGREGFADGPAGSSPVRILAEVQGDINAMRRCLLRRSAHRGLDHALPMCTGALLVAEDAIRFVLRSRNGRPLRRSCEVLCLYAGVRSLAILFPPVLMAAYRTDSLFGTTSP